MTPAERKQARMEGARAFVKWIDERKWTIAQLDDDDDFVPAGMTQLGYFREFCLDMFLVTEEEAKTLT